MCNTAVQPIVNRVSSAKKFGFEKVSHHPHWPSILTLRFHPCPHWPSILSSDSTLVLIGLRFCPQIPPLSSLAFDSVLRFHPCPHWPSILSSDSTLVLIGLGFLSSCLSSIVSVNWTISGTSVVKLLLGWLTMSTVLTQLLRVRWILILSS